MTQTQERWLTRQQAAERARVHVRTVDRWLAEGVLTRHSVAVRGTRVDAQEIDALMTPVPADDAPRTA